MNIKNFIVTEVCNNIVESKPVKIYSTYRPGNICNKVVGMDCVLVTDQYYFFRITGYIICMRIIQIVNDSIHQVNWINIQMPQAQWKDFMVI